MGIWGKIKILGSQLAPRRGASWLVLLILAAVILPAWQIYRPLDGQASEKIEFVIARGETPRAVADRLAMAGLIRSPEFFWWYARLTWQAGDFQAGKYKLSPADSTATIVQLFAEGRAESNDIKVLIYEGMNLAEIDKLMAQAGLIRLGELLNKANLSLEGQYFPDTYRFWPTVYDSAGEIKARLLENFTTKTTDLREFNQLSETEFQRILVVASLLEKEVPKIEEMRTVSGIIQNRLRKGMRLQIDATTGYAACLPKFEKGQYCDVSQANIVANLKNPNPYNTYANAGLPPGPITNPGLRAIEAAINPLPSEYYFYLSTRDGRTIYSKTGAEHEANRRKYLGR